MEFNKNKGQSHSSIGNLIRFYLSCYSLFDLLAPKDFSLFNLLRVHLMMFIPETCRTHMYA